MAFARFGNNSLPDSYTLYTLVSKMAKSYESGPFFPWQACNVVNMNYWAAAKQTCTNFVYSGVKGWGGGGGGGGGGRHTWVILTEWHIELSGVPCESLTSLSSTITSIVSTIPSDFWCLCFSCCNSFSRYRAIKIEGGFMHVHAYQC